MDEQRATLRNVEGRPAVRLERRLAHQPAKVWPAITDPAGLAHWFPATIEGELKPGATLHFSMEGMANTEGEVLEYDEPKVFAFTWNGDVLRMELFPDGDGSRLVFTHTFGRGEPATRKLTAGRTATGWGVCLDSLEARLDDRPFEPPTDWLGPIERYVEEFGLGEGEVRDLPDEFLVRFRRDVMWKSVEEIWALLTEETAVALGAKPPTRTTNAIFAPGEVTEADEPRIVEYEWLHEGVTSGRVRWEISHDPLEGTRVELTQTLPRVLAGLLPAALAVWQVQLELFFAATHGELRPWPGERVESLEKRYQSAT
ncbi:MAG: hypothetical protein QOI21_4701 [Actinomycetota bacterium]|nr:hypothetical protein [Actinomycetota bacterium]